MQSDDAALAQVLPRVGSTLVDKYVLERVIGAGGMGVVFEAAQPALGRSVAIKMIAPALASMPSARSRFADEARAASRLSHPNVAAVLDVGETGEGVPFLVMELVRGRSLTRILADEGPLAPRRAVELVTQILAALGDAHAIDLVHGDMKSDNVLVETARDGVERVKIVDFGLARLSSCAIEPDEHPGVVSGTPEYMAPEVIEGRPRSATSDLYATGIILYELVTGETPFADGSFSEILARHVAEPVVPPSLRRCDGALPPAFDLIVLRALAKDPAARFADATRFAAALSAAAPSGDADGEARPPRATRSIAERPTTDWGSAEAPRPRRTTADERARRAAAHLASSLAHGSADDVVSGYLELARSLVTSGRLVDAIRELEEATLLLDGSHPPRSLWQILAALASLYESKGTTAEARRVAASGYWHAVDGRSRIGRERTRALLDRLTRAAG